MTFRGIYAFLSNFYPCEVILDGHLYPSVEHAYQAAKVADPNDRGPFQDAPTPGDAKKLGRNVEPRPDWFLDLNVVIMGRLLRQKFEQEPFRSMLLNTYDIYISEENTWNDTFWGVCEGRGSNMLGVLIMLIRDELRQKELPR